MGRVGGVCGFEFGAEVTSIFLSVGVILSTYCNKQKSPIHFMQIGDCHAIARNDVVVNQIALLLIIQIRQIANAF